MCLTLEQNGGNSWGCTLKACRWRQTHPFFFFFLKRLFLHILCVEKPSYDWYFHFHASLTVCPAWRSFNFYFFHLPPAGPSQRLLDRSAVGEVGGRRRDSSTEVSQDHMLLSLSFSSCAALETLHHALLLTAVLFFFFSSGWPLSLPAIPSHINPILLHFGHSTNRWCFLSTRLPKSSNLSYLCLFL